MTRGPSAKRIKDLITLARTMGVKHLRAGEVEFELLPEAKGAKLIDIVTPETETKVERQPTEDELLMMSSPFYEDYRAARATGPKLP